MYDTNWSDEYLKSTGYKPTKQEMKTPEDIAQAYLDKYHAEQDMQALDDDIEAKMQRKIDSQADQDYYAQCAAEGYDPHGHDRNCDCPECVGDEPEPVPGWPPNAQTQAHCDEVMAKPDEF